MMLWIHTAPSLKPMKLDLYGEMRLNINVPIDFDSTSGLKKVKGVCNNASDARPAYTFWMGVRNAIASGRQGNRRTG